MRYICAVELILWIEILYDGDVHIKIGTKDYIYCGKRQFTITETCCKVNTQQKDQNHSDETRCCGATSFNPRYQKSCDEITAINKSKRTIYCSGVGYNSARHISCEGNVVDIAEEEDDGCCGSKPMNVNKQIFCDGYPVQRKGKITRCCCQESFIPGEEICCDGQVQKAMVDKDTRWRGKEICNPEKYLCCDDRELGKSMLLDDSCCCNKTCFFKQQICCDCEVSKRTRGENNIFYGDQGYDPGQELCCDGNILLNDHGRKVSAVQRKYIQPGEKTCCGDQLL